MRRAKILAIIISALLLFGGCGRVAVPVAPPDGAVSFLFFSDTQAGPETGDYSGFGELLSRAVGRAGKPDLVIFGGDAVNDGGDPDEWRDFWRAAAAPLDGITTAAVPGNHDNHALLAGQFDCPDKAPENPGEGFFYSFGMGPVHFIMLDSNIMGAANAADIDWLREDLQSPASRQAAWRVAVMHHPMWPPVDNPKDIQRAETMRGNFLPLMEEYGVDLILCGHQHLYARTLPTGGVVQVMAASGGKEPYAAGDRDYIAAAGGAPNYLSVTADGEALTVTAYDGNNEPFDAYTIPGTAPADDGGAWRIRVVTPGGDELWSFTEAELAAARAESFAGVYSTINNWPTPRFYAAEGYGVAGILIAAGLYDTARTVTFRAADGYEVSLTREQLLAPQYFYPQVGENGGGAEPVETIIACRWREGSDDLSEVREDRPSLIFGQRNPFEHTNPAFVAGVSEIVVDDTPSGTWPMATTFPPPGPIASGETVKLQHPDYGLVKLYYTLDGSDPTMLSAMYNPSTYQPELNRPIPITEPTVIKVLVSGYGKNDSGIAIFNFTPIP